MSTNDMSDARAARAKALAARQKSIADQVKDILGDPTTNDEMKRKLAYCQEQIAKGRDDGLVTRRRDLIAEAQRGHSY